MSWPVPPPPAKRGRAAVIVAVALGVVLLVACSVAAGSYLLPHSPKTAASSPMIAAPLSPTSHDVLSPSANAGAIESEQPGHGKSIQISDRSGGVRMRCDESRLQQVLAHLLSNAMKFTDADSVIEVAIDRVEDGIDFVVRDNGSGISPEMLSLVLEPFGQAETAYARSHGGIGLGLPIVKALMDLHGGAFTLSSQIGSGTAARIHFPAHRVVPGATGAIVKAS